MNIEDRLLALAVQVPRSDGMAADTALAQRLAAQAPDLASEIRALLAAMECVASDPAVDPARLAHEVAAALRLPLATVLPSAHVAALLGVREAPSPGPVPGGGWAGDSEFVRPPIVPPAPVEPPFDHRPPRPEWVADVFPPPRPEWVADVFPPPQRAPKPWEQLWFYGLIGALLIGAAILYMRTQGATTDVVPEIPGTTPTPSPTPTASTGPEDGEAGNLQPGGPALVTDANALPTLPVRRAASGALGIGFSVSDKDGPVQGLIVLPAGGWDAGEATIIGQRGDAASIGSGRMAGARIGAVPMRILKPTWRQDGLGVGPACIMFGGQPGASDVALQGAKVCVADAQCGQPVGCGVIP